MDALELRGEEGRGQPRKSGGRSQHPTIPGFPNGVTRRARMPGTGEPNSIGRRGETLGSEPSKYQQERKSREIPPVAASEGGGAQTGCGDAPGVVGRRLGDRRECESSGTRWEARPERARAPYAKDEHERLAPHLSTAGHEEPCRKPGRPRSKAEYGAATDSA